MLKLIVFLAALINAALIFPAGNVCLCAQTKSESGNNLFHLLDNNGDGKLGPYETLDVLLRVESDLGKGITKDSLSRLLKKLEAERRAEIESFVEEMDENEDGKLQLTEVDRDMQGFAGALDNNDDGVIEIEEALKAELEDVVFLTPGQIAQEVKHVFNELDSNRDGVLVPSEADDELSWEQLCEGDADSNQELTPEEFAAFLTADNQPATFTISNGIATMVGVINADTAAEVLKLIFEYPDVRTIVMENVPGSIDDETNLRAARYIRKFGFTTIVKEGGSVASGGTDFFLAGKKRKVESDAKLGIHSWGGFGVQGKDVPRDDPQHQLYLKYYKDMGIPAAFYWRTLDAAPADDIHWMTEKEIDKFNIRTGDSGKSSKGEANRN